MAVGRRCSICSTSWPDEAIYSKCPECGESTNRFSNLDVITPEEARSRLLHAEFEEFYRRREALK